MSTQSKTYYYSVYAALLEIEEADHHENVRFVEKNMSALRHLDIQEYFEMLCRYHQALFELGRFEKQIQIADEILEISIVQNIVEWKGEDVYFHTLFKKAASLYNSNRISEAELMLHELLKMQPEHESSKLLLINCLVKKKKPETGPFRALGIGSVLSSAAVIAIELSIIRRYFPEFIDYIELLRNFLFGLGVISLITGEVWVRYKAVDQTLELLRDYRERKKSK